MGFESFTIFVAVEGKNEDAPLLLEERSGQILPSSYEVDFALDLGEGLLGGCCFEAQQATFS